MVTYKETLHVTLHKLTCFFTLSGSNPSLRHLATFVLISGSSVCKDLLTEVVSGRFSFLFAFKPRAKTKSFHQYSLQNTIFKFQHKRQRKYIRCQAKHNLLSLELLLTLAGLVSFEGIKRMREHLFIFYHRKNSFRFFSGTVVM